MRSILFANELIYELYTGRTENLIIVRVVISINKGFPKKIRNESNLVFSVRKTFFFINIEREFSSSLVED